MPIVDITIEPKLDDRSRLKTLFRIILILPALFLNVAIISIQTTMITVPLMLCILIQKKYPRWIFEWNRAAYAYQLRLSMYFLLLTDDYPSLEENISPIKLTLSYPTKGSLSRGLPFIKWLLAIPNTLILFILLIIQYLCTFFVWLAIILIGRYPSRKLFSFCLNVMIWSARNNAYTSLLTTDQYPPFPLNKLTHERMVLDESKPN